MNISFSTAVRAVEVKNTRYFFFLILFTLALGKALVIKLVILGILFLSSFFLALTAAVAAKLVISGILSSISLIISFVYHFLFFSFFYQLHHLIFFKSTGTGFNL